ncbi:MAG: M14 family zinc carboxypeptidase, partial [Planctomycetota bacterium]
MRTILRASLLALTAALPAQLPGPVEALGREVGADHFLANYTQLTAWWEQLAAGSDRMRLEPLGKTAYGLDMQLAILSSPENLARLDEIREINARLALGRDVDEAVARELAARGRTVIWIDAGMHATE